MGGLLPSPPLINVLPIWESRLCARPLPILRAQASQGAEGRGSTQASLSKAHAHCQRPPGFHQQRFDSHPQISCREKGPSSQTRFTPTLRACPVSSSCPTPVKARYPSWGETEMQLTGNLGTWVTVLNEHSSAPTLACLNPSPGTLVTSELLPDTPSVTHILRVPTPLCL